MFELFILSKLLHRPMHGYLIQTILNSALGPARRVSWGTLYPLIRRLEKNGFIMATDENGNDPRGKRQYRATVAGRARFIGLMNSRSDLGNNSADSFRIKLGSFGHLDDDVRLQIVTDYRCYLLRIRSHTESMAERILNEGDPFPQEKHFALLALEHQRIVTQSEIDWTDSVLLERRRAFSDSGRMPERTLGA
jgi:DNA-binding PadR family transcriptional regulator